jgi:hypothetical protein
MGGNLAADWAALRHGLPAGDIDEWDPAYLLDFAVRLPIPAKVTIEVLPPVDREQSFGPDPDPDEVYDMLTDDMQAALTTLQDERTLPVLG